MARFKQSCTVRFRTTLDGEIEETEFAAGDVVRVIATWTTHYLVKDEDGHFYNIRREFLDR